MRWSAGSSRRRVSVALVAVLATAHLAVGAAPASASVGDVEWTRQFGTSGYDEAAGVAVGPDGSVYVAGFTEEELAGGGGSAGHFDGFLRKYSASGAVTWTRQFGTVKGDYPYAVAVGADGNVYVVGDTGLRVDEGGDGDFDAFVRQYDSDGTAGWTDTFGGDTFDGAFGVAVGSDGSVYVVGWADDALAGGGGHQGGFDAYVRKYDSAGAVQWTRQFGTSEFDSAGGVAVGSDGGVYVAGSTSARSPVGAAPQATAMRTSPSSTQTATNSGRANSAPASRDSARAVAVGADGTIYVTGSTSGALPGGGGHAGKSDVFLRAYDAAGTVKWTRQFGTGAMTTRGRWPSAPTASTSPDGPPAIYEGPTQAASMPADGGSGGSDAGVVASAQPAGPDHLVLLRQPGRLSVHG
jgi:hypothetical protein